jgi:hypothetical protein
MNDSIVAGLKDWKRILAGIVAVWLTWEVADAVIHGVILMPIYGETAALWRPMEEMKSGLMALVVFIMAGAFVKTWALLISPKSLGRALLFGLYWGGAAGVSMGFGTYAFMDIPLRLALGWFIGTAVEGVLAGLVVGLIIREKPVAVE